MNGFCPSFVTVHGGELKKPERRGERHGAPDLFEALPDPALPDTTEPYGILITGVGGTGVVTIGALLGMAAHLEGKGASVFDMTGLSQKNGAVYSHLRVFADGETEAPAHVGIGEADLILGCDLVAAGGAEAIA